LSARIAGVVRTPEDVSDAPDPFLSLSPSFYEKYHDAVGGCLCNVLINADPQAIDAVTAELKEVYPGAAIEPSENLAGRIDDTVALQRRTWWLIALAAALAGLIALFQASTRAGRILMSGDDALRALGMTQRERRLGCLLVVTTPIVAGAAAAVGFAYALSPLAPVGLTRLAEPSPGLRWEPAVVVPGVVILLAVSLAIAGSATVASSRRVRQRATGRPLGGPSVAFGNRLALGPGRGAIMGVALCSAGLVGALTLQHSLDHVLATPALYGADFDASSFIFDGADKRALAQQLAADHDFEAVGLVWAQQKAAMHVVGPGGEADVDPSAFESIKGTTSVKVTEGRAPERADEVAVGRGVLDRLGAHVGDRITAITDRGSTQVTIVGDNLDPGVDVAGQGFAMTRDGLTQLVSATTNGVVVRFAPGSNHAQLLARYSTVGLTPVAPPSEVVHIGQLGGLPGRVGQLLMLLGVAALLNAMVLTVRSGRHEVALHRALGFTSAQVVGVHVWQGLVTAFTGVFIGGSVGFVVGRAIDRQLVSNVGAIADTVLPTEVWVAVSGTVAACLVAGVITSAAALRHRPGFELRAE
jgi:predicted lysophospholipase L1 biosynthesis ABC-type transport system permease subunit